MFNSRALVQFKLGAFDRAVADYDVALKQTLSDADSLYGRGVAKLKSGDTAGGDGRHRGREGGPRRHRAAGAPNS